MSSSADSLSPLAARLTQITHASDSSVDSLLLGANIIAQISPASSSDDNLEKLWRVLRVSQIPTKHKATTRLTNDMPSPTHHPHTTHSQINSQPSYPFSKDSPTGSSQGPDNDGPYLPASPRIRPSDQEGPDDQYTPENLWKISPTILDEAARDLSTLRPLIWLGGQALNYWLFHRSLMGDDGIRYLSMEYLRPEGQLDDDEIAIYRKHAGLPPRGPCRQERLIGVLHVGGASATERNHYAVLLVIPERLELHLLGYQYSVNNKYDGTSNWDAWSGSRIWQKICQLHGWNVRPVKVKVVNWTQNGHDCGVIAAQVIAEIWAHGFTVDPQGFWEKPILPCAHVTRIWMASDLKAHIRKGIDQFRILATNNPYLVEEHFRDLGELLDDLEAQIDIVAVADAAIEANRRAIATCRVCLDTVRRKQPHGRKCIRQLTRDYPALRGAKPVVAISRGISSEVDDDADKGNDGGSSSSPDDMAKGSVKASVSRCVADLSQARAHRFPRPTEPVDLPIRRHLKGLRQPFDRFFDEYETGPTLETLDPVPDTIIQFGTAGLTYIADQVEAIPWQTWKDYGWRLMPDFSQAFDLREPILVKEHFLRPGITGVPGPQVIPTCQTRRGDKITENDCIKMGAQAMINYAAEEQHPEVFLTGRTKENQYIRVDLQEDATDLGHTDLNYTCDIDSMIYVTVSPRFAQAVEVFAAPVIRDRAPIFKHNHVYVDLLVPQSEEDRAEIGRERNEWWTQRMRLSRLPHVLFGKLGSHINVLMFFPRMAHQHPYTHRWIACVPSHIQQYLWDRVIIPSMRRTMHESTHPYVGLDRTRVEFKRGNQGSATPSYPFLTTQFVELIKHIKEQIAEAEDLAQFGSPFWVAELKGSKSFSKIIASGSVTMLEDGMKRAWKQFAEEFAALDIPYMEARQNGELYIDGGITLHPSQPETPLVGLLNLEYLEASLGASGYVAGSHHQLNTLNQFGGVQAELKEARSQRTHILFFSAYNLAYEVTRKMDNNRDLFKASEAYGLGDNYVEEHRQLIKIYEEAMQGDTSYGVRIEFRVGIQGFNKILPVLDARIRTLLERGGVLWLPASTWFRFLQQRAIALFNAQFAIYRLDPRNLGVLTGILTYMQQSIIFTPPRVETHVMLSLSALRYASTIGRFGMFFLHDWDPTEDGVLPDVQQRDDTVVLKALKKPLRLRRPAPSASAPSALYPIGLEPTWAEVKKALESEPWNLMREWSWPEQLDQHVEAGEGSPGQKAVQLFITMTGQLFAGLNQAWKVETIPVNPRHLEEALKCWTVPRIFNSIRATKFVACNADLEGPIDEQRVNSFEGRVGLYFPKAPVKKTKWQAFATDPGYIADYVDACEQMEDFEVEEMDEALGMILRFCHCLPDSNRTEVWSIDRQQHVRILANPKYYQLVKIGPGAGKGRATRRANTYTGKMELKRRMLEMKGYTRGVAKHAVNLQKKVERGEVRKKHRGVRRGVPPKRIANGDLPVTRTKSNISGGCGDQGKGVQMQTQTQKSSSGTDLSSPKAERVKEVKQGERKEKNKYRSARVKAKRVPPKRGKVKEKITSGSDDLSSPGARAK